MRRFYCRVWRTGLAISADRVSRLPSPVSCLPTASADPFAGASLAAATARMMRLLVCTLAATVAVTAQGGPSTGRTLPDLQPFLQQVRARLQPDDARQVGYAFTYTERKVKYDSKGRPGAASVTITESYPGFAPGEPRWDRVIEEEGHKVPEADLQQKDAERRKEAEAFARRLQDPRERARLVREREEDHRKARERIDDVFRVFDIAIVGREAIEGHDTIVVSLTPRPAASPRTREGRWMKAFKGRAWLSESEYELARLDVEAVDSVSIGLGLVARMHKGSTASFSRRKVDGDAWLPARAEYRFNAQVLLFKSMREGGTVDFSNYRRFSVDTTTAIGAPHQP
jgi:hypothetical protein